MNNVIESLLNHRSIRSYLDEDVSQDFIELIAKASLAAPSSINGQHVEWAKHNININGIAPGYMATNNTKQLRADEDRSNDILARIPQGR